MASLGIYTLIVLVSLWGMQVVLPVVLPFMASSLVLLTTGLLGHVMASRRMAPVEQDMPHIQQDPPARVRPWSVGRMRSSRLKRI
ncbi:MAG: hypothetical protein U0231_10515 [Nitrospiraceae bacterium]